MPVVDWEGIKSPGTKVTVSCHIGAGNGARVLRKSSPGPPEEQPVVLATQPSLQPLSFYISSLHFEAQSHYAALADLELVTLPRQV